MGSTKQSYCTQSFIDVSGETLVQGRQAVFGPWFFIYHEDTVSFPQAGNISASFYPEVVGLVCKLETGSNF